MGNKSALELGGWITKPVLKKIVKTKILLSRPEIINLITDKVLVKCLIFISGYIKSLKSHMIEPINVGEIDSLLEQECIDWIIEYVDKGGK